MQNICTSHSQTHTFQDGTETDSTMFPTKKSVECLLVLSKAQGRGNRPRWVDPTHFQVDVTTLLQVTFQDFGWHIHNHTQIVDWSLRKPRYGCSRPRWFDSTQFQISVTSLGDASGTLQMTFSQVPKIVLLLPRKLQWTLNRNTAYDLYPIPKKTGGFSNNPRSSTYMWVIDRVLRPFR